ncbi:unnamed protein product [Soboliphyme baturini]|uniref:Uncharacterized protein n=1 Tax=Soboliphyme baturini TaxID=241478 RepID=A0A183J6S3_9BILA|nr:unnamed protein product [Soboliphyme baturini]
MAHKITHTRAVVPQVHEDINVNVINPPPSIVIQRNPPPVIQNIHVTKQESQACLQAFALVPSHNVLVQTVSRYRVDGYIPGIGHPTFCDGSFNYYRIPNYKYIVDLKKKKA